MAEDFIGTGFKFPMSVDHTGGIAMSSGSDSIEQGMRMIIGTAPGERAMRPDFGCAIWDDMFGSINPTTLGRMELAVREALGQWEPRAIVDEVEAIPSGGDGRVDINVRYRMRDSNDVRNLVHPFYVIPEE